MKSLAFRPDGTFKIMQVADVQDTQHTAPDTVAFLEAALAAEKPDLVIFTGDQLKGYGVSFRGGDQMEKVRTAIENIIRPVEAAGIPFAVTFGNHDEQSGAGKADQMKMYESYPHFIRENTYTGLEGNATFVLEVKVHGQNKTALNVFVIDSLSKDKESGGYAAVTPGQLEWFRHISSELAEKNEDPAPGILFQHIPVPEMYELLEKTDKNMPGAVLGNATHRDYYVLPEALAKDPRNFMLENIACPTCNSGEFKALKADGNIFAAFFGHDHNNSFVGNYKGIDLGYCQGCGFNVYGPGLDRGVRIFEFKEKSPRDYSTRTVTYRDLMGRKLKKPLKNLIYTYAPSSMDAAKPLIAKTCAVAALGAVVGLGLALLHR